MIQRKQTLFLLAALILTVICLCLPLGTLTPKAMTPPEIVTHFGSEAFEESPVVPFLGWACLVLSCPFSLVTIFTYKNRRMQMALTLLCALLCALWAVAWAYRVVVFFPSVGSYHMSWSVVLPVISFILYFMARHYIKKDDDLVRSMDRIR